MIGTHEDPGGAPHTTPGPRLARGRVLRVFSGGFGFIRAADGGALYFDRDALDGIDIEALSAGARVAFLASADRIPRAIEVRLAR